MNTGYPTDPWLRRLTPANGWRHELIPDAYGRPDVVVAVRVGPVWTDSVAIAGEDQTVRPRARSGHR